MAGREDEAEEIIPDLIVDRRVQFQAFLSLLEIASDLFVLALERLAPPDQVDRPVLRCPHEPAAGPLGHALDRPLLERGDQGVLRELLSRPYVSDDASQPGDEPGRLHVPDRFDRAMRFGGCCGSVTVPRGRVCVSETYRNSSSRFPRTRRPRGSRTFRH